MASPQTITSDSIDQSNSFEPNPQSPTSSSKNFNVELFQQAVEHVVTTQKLRKKIAERRIEKGSKGSSTLLQVIDGSGEFKLDDLEEFIESEGMVELGSKYTVVAIMGPQSSGKSTLLNRLFGTRFQEMDAYQGRSQTTQGIWLAKAQTIAPCTLVCDLEGTDGRERGEDDTAFEKRSSLFALAIADVVLVNMWCHDVGREHGASVPLLKTVFQAMMKLFNPKKTTLLFILRDKTKTPMEILDSRMRDDLDRIWGSLTKPEKYSDTPLSEFFNLEITSLPNYEEKEELFHEEVLKLQSKFSAYSLDEFVFDKKVPASGFTVSAKKIWEKILENKDLDLPAHKIMVATVRCEQIVYEQLAEIESLESFKRLKEDVKKGEVMEFGKIISNIVKNSLNKYDVEASFFDESVRNSKKKFLKQVLKDRIKPMFDVVLSEHSKNVFEELKLKSGNYFLEGERKHFSKNASQLSAIAFKSFESKIADACVDELDFSSSEEKNNLKIKIAARIYSLIENYLSNSFSSELSTLFESCNEDTWRNIKKLYEAEVNYSKGEIGNALKDLDVNMDVNVDANVDVGLHGDSIIHEYQSNISHFAKAQVEKITKTKSELAVVQMKNKFSTIFGRDSNLMPRVWTGKEDIRAITKQARLGALQVLSVLAAIRLGDQTDEQDTIQKTLTGILEEGEKSTPISKLTSNQWNIQAPGIHQILSPAQCANLWGQFIQETEYEILRAVQTQEMSRRNNSWMPPPWAIMAMVVLGFNEFMALLRNPLLLIFLIAFYVVSRIVWVKLEIANSFDNGMVAGFFDLGIKFSNLLSEAAKTVNSEIHSVNSGVRSTTSDAHSVNSPIRKEIQLKDFSKSEGFSSESQLDSDSVNSEPAVRRRIASTRLTADGF